MPATAKMAAIYQSGADFKLPEYTGSYELCGNRRAGYIRLLTDGTLTLSPFVYELCLVGGGGGGADGSISEANVKIGAGGGCGGFVTNVAAQAMEGEHICVIGSGGHGYTATTGAGLHNNESAGRGGTTTMGEYSALGGYGAKGSNAQTKGRGTSGAGGNGGTVPQVGSDGVFAFDDAAMPLLSGCGSGGCSISAQTQKAGGAGGGGAGGLYQTSGTAGLANTGGGGGGGGGKASLSAVGGSGGDGGSGVIIVRWGG